MKSKLRDQITRTQDLLYFCEMSLVTIVLGPLAIYAIYSVIVFVKSLITGNAFGQALADVGAVYYSDGHLSALISLTLTVMAGIFGFYLFITMLVLLRLGICKLRLKRCP